MTGVGKFSDRGAARLMAESPIRGGLITPPCAAPASGSPADGIVLLSGPRGATPDACTAQASAGAAATMTPAAKTTVAQRRTSANMQLVMTTHSMHWITLRMPVRRALLRATTRHPRLQQEPRSSPAAAESARRRRVQHHITAMSDVPPHTAPEVPAERPQETPPPYPDQGVERPPPELPPRPPGKD